VIETIIAPAAGPARSFVGRRGDTPGAVVMGRTIRLAVLISGGGTTLHNLLQRIADGRLDAEIALVIASRADAAGLAYARAANVATRVVSPKSAGFADEVYAACRAAGAELVCLAGFLHLLPVADDFRGRVLNIHPSLIPAFCGKGFYGRRVHEAALAMGVKLSGCTVHFADDVYDHGPIVLQRAVPVQDDDTPETLAARVFAAECEAYPEAITLFAQGRLVVDGRRVRTRPAPAEKKMGTEQ
jgi:phosphoribosylglycinamide formyltransferase-1